MGPFSQKHPPRAILFDHDGVLVASEPLHWRAWRTLCQELGLPYDEAIIKGMIGTTAPQVLAELLNSYRPGWSPADYDLDALARRKNDLFLKTASTELSLYPGVAEGLRWLKANGIRSAVVSNAKRRELEAALRQLGVFDLFDTVISRDEAGASKPDPTPYLAAAAFLGFEPGECIAVEDSPPGLEAALLAKVPAAALLTNFPREAVAQPVPGRPDLRPAWIHASIQEFFDELKRLTSSRAE